MPAIELLTRPDFSTALPAAAGAPAPQAATGAEPPGTQFGDVLSHSIDSTSASGPQSGNGQPGNLQSGNPQPERPQSGSSQSASPQSGSSQSGSPQSQSGSLQSAGLQSGNEHPALVKTSDGNLPSAGDAQKPSRQNVDPAAAPPAGNGAPTDQLALLAAALSGVNHAPVVQTPPAISTGASNSKGDNPALQLAAVPGAAPALLVSNLLQADAATSATASAATTGTPQEPQNQSRAVLNAQAGDVNAPQALITDLQQAARVPEGPPKLTPDGQAAAGTPASDAGQNSTPAGAQRAAPPAMPPDPDVAAAPPADMAHAGNLVSLIPTSTISTTTTVSGISSAGNSSATGQTNAGIGTDSHAPQVAVASTAAANGSGTSPALPLSSSSSNSSSGVAGSTPVAVVTLVGNSFAQNAAHQSAALPATPADSSPGIVQVSAPVLPSTPASSTTSALDKSSPAQPTNANDASQPVPQQGSQNAGFPPFGAAPPSLQLHSTSFTAGQPGSSVLLNPAQVIDQVAYAVQYSHANGQQMQLHLNPPELGALQVDVSLRDGVLSARIEAQTPTAQQILTDNIAQLKDSLTQQGVSFDRIDVHLAGSHAGFGGSGMADKSFARQQDGSLPWEQQFVEPERDNSAMRAPVPVVRNSRNPLTSLDIMI